MDYKLRIVIEKVEVKTNKVVDKNKIAEYAVEKPKTIAELGLSHKAQISLLKKVQQALLEEQMVYIGVAPENCPQCGYLLKKNGYKQSSFHAVFSDHQLKIQRHRCPSCGYNDVPSIKSLLGTSIHPELYKLQCELGSSFSFLKSEKQLTNLCQEKREINNHQRIKKTVNAIGEALFDITVKDQRPLSTAPELIVQVDGGHIKDKDQSKRSFEALAAKIYRPEAVVLKGKRRQIKNKACVASAKNDKLKSIKLLIISAAKRQGMSPDTKVTVVADGAKNCWQATMILSKENKNVEYVLDWFHIAKKFQPIINSLSGDEQKRIESIKWNIWHGKQHEAMTQLEEAIPYFAKEEFSSQLAGIYIYLQQNQKQLCNYAERKAKGLVFTSHVAESTVEHLINERHKRKQKMQWTRESAHHILQIRASIASCDWSAHWQEAVFASVRKAA